MMHFKLARYRKKIIEKKCQNMLKEIFTSVLKYLILHKERKIKINLL